MTTPTAAMAATVSDGSSSNGPESEASEAEASEAEGAGLSTLLPSAGSLSAPQAPRESLGAAGAPGAAAPGEVLERSTGSKRAAVLAPLPGAEAGGAEQGHGQAEGVGPSSGRPSAGSAPGAPPVEGGQASAWAAPNAAPDNESARYAADVARATQLRKELMRFKAQFKKVHGRSQRNSDLDSGSTVFRSREDRIRIRDMYNEYWALGARGIEPKR